MSNTCRYVFEKERGLPRREFLRVAGAGLGSLVAMNAGAECAWADTLDKPTAAKPLSGHRFLTFNTVIRVNQIEATRAWSVGTDEADKHDPAKIADFRQAIAAGWPGGRITWSLSWLALHDQRPNYRKLRQMVADYHERYGDDVTFIPGGYFAPMYNSSEQINRDLHDGLARVTEIMGGGFRPRSVVAGYLSAPGLKFLAETEGIHVCQGNIWSQFAIDHGDGEGSICYPYYPSTEHFCKPAQGKADFIDCVNLDGWTVDFLFARLVGIGSEGNSRRGVGPGETIWDFGPEKGLEYMMATMATHFDAGFALNHWGWITTCWETVQTSRPWGGGPYDTPQHETLTKWLGDTRKRWPDSQLITQGEFGELWRKQYSDNSFDYRFVQKGSVDPSKAHLGIRWFMNKDFRLALLRDTKAGGPDKVIDYTRYDLSVREPRKEGDTSFIRGWTLFGQINQKGTRPQDKPVPLGALPAEDQQRILARYPQLKA